MAKFIKGANKRQKKSGEINFDSIQGVLSDGQHCNIEYNKISRRYVLRTGADQGGDLLFSSISLTPCKNKAAEKGVIWR